MNKDVFSMIYPSHRTPGSMRVLYLKSSENKKTPAIRIKSEKTFGLMEDHVIICRNCGNAITTPENIITVNGRHQHVFTNPSGITYTIGCFSSAEGCTVMGELTSEFTWFEGFSWNFSTCSKCSVHLGWHYQNRDNHFFGLIPDLLRDTASPHG
jgi:hypothetical protein